MWCKFGHVTTRKPAPMKPLYSTEWLGVVPTISECGDQGTIHTEGFADLIEKGFQFKTFLAMKFTTRMF